MIKIYKCFFKRIIDILLSGIGIVILLIPMGIFALIIKAEDSGPALFKQKRVGKNKKLFKEHKNITAYKSFTEKEIKVA